MEDLDSLLEDLGRGKSNTQSNGSSARPPSQRPISTRVDLNELEDLMEDLAAPTAKKTPDPTPAPIQQSASSFVVEANPAPAPAPVNNRVSTYDNNNRASTYDNNSFSGNNNTVDDLEALMESLNVASNNRNSSRRSTKPDPVPVQATTPKPAPAPVHREDPKPYSNPSPPPAVVQQKSTPPPATNGPVKGDDLDNLLNNLTSQMDHIEPDNPASRGQCATCKGAILGEMMQALGRCYHPEHFTCGNCHQPIGTKNFFEQNGLPHCQDCFQNMFCPKCAHCNGAIMDRCITAMGKKWHPDHFICGQCLKPFPGGNFFEKDGRPYCEADFFALFAPKCGACHEPVKGDTINALGQQWHPEHFVCTYCGKAFSGTFFEHANKPYCEAHYHQQTGSCCGGCGKPITGRCVNALDKKWHPEHFVCAFCMNPLAGGAFTEKNNKAYCKECHSKLFGN